MQKKSSKKLSASFTLMVVAMLSLVGVGFAVGYSGSATVTDNQADSQTVTVDLDKFSGFVSGSYTVNTVNDGTAITLNTLKKGDSAATLDSLEFAWDSTESKFTVTDADAGYDCSKIGEITVSVKQLGAADPTIALTIDGAQASIVHQYGLSFLYVYDGEVFDPTDGISVAMTNGEGSAVVSAYVLYSKSVPYANLGDIDVFTLSDATITFIATV